jgi:hypothetical protein
MSEVVHRGHEGQGSDPSEARVCLERFVKVAHELNNAWDRVLDGGGYPAYLPSFDEFVSALSAWRDQVTERLEVAEDEDIPPVNFGDRTEVRAWLKQVQTQVADAVTAGEDATRPIGQRSLGRPIPAPPARKTVRPGTRAALDLLLGG